MSKVLDKYLKLVGLLPRGGSGGGGGTEPKGTKYIEENGVYDVKKYAEADVSVSASIYDRFLWIINDTGTTLYLYGAYTDSWPDNDDWNQQYLEEADNPDAKLPDVIAMWRRKAIGRGSNDSLPWYGGYVPGSFSLNGYKEIHKLMFVVGTIGDVNNLVVSHNGDPGDTSVEIVARFTYALDGHALIAVENTDPSWDGEIVFSMSS